MSEAVVFLCGPDELDKERRGYARAFERRVEVVFVSPGERREWRDRIRTIRPLLVLNPDGRWWLPEGIEELDAPTAAFHIDTFAGTNRRVLAAALYDHVFVFHPGFAKDFGHPGVHVLPHAADASMLHDPNRKRTYDVGWVGHRRRAIYHRRDAALRALSSRFAMNDVDRSYTSVEMADLYGNSRIVVNVSRDDWPQDANMRCFEAMAAGALLVTRVPTELTEFGFSEGVHFAGYRDHEDIVEVVARYLAHADERIIIANRGHDLVSREHTYDARVKAIMDVVRRGARAPARDWPAVRAWRRHFEVHVEQGDVEESIRWLRRIRRASFTTAARCAPRLIRLAAKVVRRTIRRRTST